MTRMLEVLERMRELEADLEHEVAAAQERFDMRVRNDFFAGFAGNQEALDRAMKLCEEELARNPGNAAALVWHGSGVFFESRTHFRAGDQAKGIEFWQRGLGDLSGCARRRGIE